MAKRNGRNTQLEDYEEHFEPQLHKILGHKFRLKCKNEAQKEFSKLITEKEIVIAAGPAGTGKAQPLDAKVLTPTGWTTMGEINVCDTIMGANGKTTKVVEIHPQGVKPIYKVTFSDNSSTECCDEHLWLTQTDKDRNHRVGKGVDRIRRPKGGSVKSLSEIRKTLLIRGRKNHTIPIIKPVEFKQQETLVDPYLMGCLLGDGSISTNNISITSDDIELIENINSVISDNCYTRKIQSSKYAYSINSLTNNNPILDELRELKLSGTKSNDKFIPEKYLINSVNTRISILQGLMDTDGTVDSRGGTTTSFTSVSKRLIDNVGFIILSLGGTYSVTSKLGKYKDKLGNIIETQEAFTLSMKLPANINPFRLSRKADLVTAKSRYGAVRYITNVEYIGDKEAKCITIANEDHLYITDDFIVTHNSFVAIARGIELLQNVSNPYNKVVISKPAVESEEKLGFMPGDMREKLEPHLSSSLDIVDKIVGKANRMKMEAQDLLVIQPLGFIRGKTFDNSIIIVEEAQNLSGDQCKALLSRIGYGSKLIISGDLDQSDRYKDVKQSGLYDLFVKHRNVEEIGFHQFGLGDIVRNPLITKLLSNYETHAMPDMSKAIPHTIAKSVVSPPKPVRPKVRVIPEGSGAKLGIFNGLKTFFSKKFAW